MARISGSKTGHWVPSPEPIHFTHWIRDETKSPGDEGWNAGTHELTGVYPDQEDDETWFCLSCHDQISPLMAQTFLRNRAGIKEVHVYGERVFPVVITSTRYGGVYENYDNMNHGGWAAFPVEDLDEVPDDAFGSDVECAGWWAENEEPIGLGASPSEALCDLLDKVAADEQWVVLSTLSYPARGYKDEFQAAADYRARIFDN